MSRSAPDRVLCKSALLGLLWSFSFFLIGIPGWSIPVDAYDGAEPVISPTLRVLQVLVLLALAGFVGGPVLSSVALTRIRRSAGRLYGAGMAAVGAWLVPAVAIGSLASMAVGAIADSLTDDEQAASAIASVGSLLVLVAVVLRLARVARRAEREADRAALAAGSIAAD